MAFDVVRNPTPRSDDDAPRFSTDPGFGRYFTDHMVRID